jgi:hypothetical protein
MSELRALNTVSRPERAMTFERDTPASSSRLETGNQRVSRLPLLISLSALVIAAGSAAWTTFRSPLGPGISAYDFTTPQNAIDSSLAIQINGDIRALMDLQRLQSRYAQEKRETLKVHRDAEYQGKKILFISFKENGITKYETEAVEKDAETGLWFPAYVSPYGMDDAALERTIKAWGNRTDGASQ